MDLEFSAVLLGLLAIALLAFEMKAKKASALWLFIVPAIVFFATIVVIKEEFFSAYGSMAFLSIVFGIGLYFGVGRGKLAKVEKSESGEIVIRGTILYAVFWFFVLMLKISAVDFLSSSRYISSALLSSLLLIFACGSLLGKNYELMKKYFEAKKAPALAQPGGETK